STTAQNGKAGISVQGGSGNTVQDVTSDDNDNQTYGTGTTDRLAQGIDISAGSVGTVVEDSTLYGNDDSGVQSYSGSSGSVIRRNLIYDNGDHGIDNNNATGTLVASNTVVDNTSSGINFEAGSTGGTTYDNVVMDNSVPVLRTSGQIRVDPTAVSGVSLNRDLVYNSSGGPVVNWADTPYTSLSGFQAAVPGQEVDGLDADPQFVDLAGRDLRLSFTSPALDAAATGFPGWDRADNVGQQPVDVPGVPNTGSGTTTYADIGALERTGTPPPPPVGPPHAQLTATPGDGQAPEWVRLDASGSTATGAARVIGYSFSCGNRQDTRWPRWQSSATTICRYALPGWYVAHVTVRDDHGQTDTSQVTVHVRPGRVVHKVLHLILSYLQNQHRHHVGR
ncbi:MAG: right-handed parallel beta-helix repeat-containing protein, partial [Nocardioidaceae bacterium]